MVKQLGSDFSSIHGPWSSVSADARTMLHPSSFHLAYKANVSGELNKLIRYEMFTMETIKATELFSGGIYRIIRHPRLHMKMFLGLAVKKRIDNWDNSCGLSGTAAFPFATKILFQWNKRLYSVENTMFVPNHVKSLLIWCESQAILERGVFGVTHDSQIVTTDVCLWGCGVHCSHLSF